MREKFQNLNLKDAFLFGAALQDEETCCLILEIILGFRVGKIKVHAENALLFSSDFRSLRLDIYASDEMQVEYNVEMQNEDEKNLALRARFHQAEMDVTSLLPGEDFSKLRTGYVIFICTFDPFGKGLYRYTFENRCLEDDFSLEDKTRKIFLSTKGKNAAQVPALLVDFLGYVENSTDAYVQHISDGPVRKIHEKIGILKKNREWERRYMRFEELLQQSEQQGIRQGREEGSRQMLALVEAMLAGGEVSEIPRLKTEPVFLRQMLKKYHLQER